MYKTCNVAVLVSLVLSLFAPVPALAQVEGPQIIHSTKPISGELKDFLEAWLAVDPPSDAVAYVTTYAKTKEAGDTQVSLAGVNVGSLAEDWSLFESIDTVVWIGSVTVLVDGSVVPFTDAQARGSGGHNAIPAVPAGGGTYVAFPFQSGTAMIYGPRGVHGSGDYGTTGMLAVDLLSGDDLGAAAAPPYAYASDTGTIDYICDDGTTVAVRTHNETTDDYFLYAHLIDNAGLALDESFSRGQSLGNIKYGSFDDDCGWAEQQEDHYHIHWMFEPSGGAFQAEGCILSTSTQKWTCGTETIGTGGWLRGGGGYGSGLDDLTGGSGANADPNFWDYMVQAFAFVFQRTILKFAPAHRPFPFVQQVIHTIQLMLRIVYVLTYSNLNVGPLAAVFVYGVGVQALMFLLWVGSFLLRVRNLVGAAKGGGG